MMPGYVSKIPVSMLDSSFVTSDPGRYNGPANPVGNVLNPTREMAPLKPDADPRVQHPKLNYFPWSVTYAVKRTEKREMKRKRKRAGKG